MTDALSTLLADASTFCSFTSLDWLGCVASACVLLTFCMQSLVRLRVIALLSNVAFIGYGWAGRLMPILILHCLLLIINSVSLVLVVVCWAKRARERAHGSTPSSHLHGNDEEWQNSRSNQGANHFRSEQFATQVMPHS
jgi:hypothetical protein